MNKLDQNLIDTISSQLKGKKLEKFIESINAINDSIEAGGWIRGASKKRSIGFNDPGAFEIIEVPYDHEDRQLVRDLKIYIHYGSAKIKINIEECSKYIALKNKFTLDFVVAWSELKSSVYDACKELDLARPLPVVTEIGISATVTKTLKEMNLDIDLKTIKLAKISHRMEPRLNQTPSSPDFGKPFLDKEGKVIMERVYYVDWSKGIKHNQSRFADKPNHCHACGHKISSGRFVPIEAYDNNQGSVISMWLGCDCSKNIFGIKDIGIKKD